MTGDGSTAVTADPEGSTANPPVCSVRRRLASESADSDLDVQLHCSSSLEAEPEAVVLQPESPPLASAFAIAASFEEDVLDLK